MRMLRCRWVLAVWLVNLFLGTAVEAALTWRVDFNGAAGDTLSTSNFTGWIVSSTSRTQVLANVDGGVLSSNIAVRLLGGGTWSTYERVMNASTATNLYRDGAQTTVSGITVSITNLTPGVSYGVRFWYFDSSFSVGTTQTYVNVTDGSSVGLGSLTNRGSAQLPNSLYDSRYCLYAEMTAGSAGSIDVTVTPNSGNTKINALEVTALGNPSAVLGYSGSSFSEADANNGTVTNTLTLTLSGDAFTGNNGDDFLSLGKASAGNIPSGLTAVLTRQSSSALLLSLSGQASAHAAANSVSNMSLTFSNAAFTLNLATNVTGYSKTNLAVTFSDPPVRSLSYSSTVFTEASANDGSIGNTLTLSLNNEQFTGSNGDDLIALGKASAVNVPSGLQAVLTRQDASTLVLSLTGQAVAHASANGISDLSLTFGDTAFVLGMATNVSGYSRTNITVTFSDPPVRSLSYSSTTFAESALDNGAIENTLTITLSNEQFTGNDGDNLIALGKAVVGNVPAGLTATLTRQSASAAVFSLTGQATSHEATNSISNLSLTFSNSAFAGGAASGVTGYSRLDISVNFNGLLIEGPADGVFLAWSSYPGATYRIEVSTNLTAVSGGFIPVVTNIPATLAYNRRYVAPTGADTEFYRVVRE